MLLATYGSAFNQLLDDSPLGTGEISSSALTATAFHAVGPGEKGAMRESSASQEVEKGLLLLIASDTPGLQVRSALLFARLISKMKRYYEYFGTDYKLGKITVSSITLY